MALLADGKTKKLKSRGGVIKDDSMKAAKEAFLAEQKFYKEVPKNIFAEAAKSAAGEKKLKKAEGKKKAGSSAQSAAKVAFLAPKLFNEINAGAGVKKKLKKVHACSLPAFPGCSSPLPSALPF